MSAQFPVFLDACILVPATLRDVLLTAAEADLYRPPWSADVLNEMERTLVERIGLAESAAAHVRAEMEGAFLGSMVTGYDDLIDSMTNHEGDRHVLAAAARGNAELIVTENLRHFPLAACQPYGIEPVPTDAFLCDLLDLDERRVCQVLSQLEKDRRDISVTDILRTLSGVAPQFARGAAFHLGIQVM